MIYFLRDAEAKAVKIGRAADVASRVSALQCASPRDLTLVCVLEGDHPEEAVLHKEFAAYHLRGEWFRWTPEIEERCTLSLPLDNLPLPKRTDRAPRLTDQLYEMEPGGTRIFTDAGGASIRRLATRLQEQYGRRYTCRSTPEGYQVWRTV